MELEGGKDGKKKKRRKKKVEKVKDYFGDDSDEEY